MSGALDAPQSTLFIDPEVYGNRMNQPTEAPTVRLTQLAHGGG